MAWTIEQHDALEEAIATGARRVKYEDKEVEYPSMDRMRNLLAEMKRHLGLAPKVVKRRVGHTRSGLQ